MKLSIIKKRFINPLTVIHIPSSLKNHNFHKNELIDFLPHFKKKGSSYIKKN